MLDYMSEELMKSKFVDRRPSFHFTFISESNVRINFLSNFSCYFPWAIQACTFFF